MPRTLLSSRSKDVEVQKETEEYVTSESDEQESLWGQPPASHYVFRIGGFTTQENGGGSIYVRAFGSLTKVEMELRDYATEMEAWNRASARGFFKFEQDLE